VRSITSLYYYSPIGRILLSEKAGLLTRLEFDDGSACGDMGGSTVLDMSVKQLDEYFAGSRKVFSLPLGPEGTEFQKTVWSLLLDVGYGETAAYGDIAAGLKMDYGFRSIGQAIHENPISIIIPCHRIVGTDGEMTGYSGGLERKKFLLDLERRC